MNATTTQRRVIDIAFSRDFESLLIQTTTNHISLTHDLEHAAQRGLDALQELEDVRDIQHIDYVCGLIEQANRLSVMDSVYFTHWKVAVSEDLLDEIDLLILSHGSDLGDLGLHVISPAVIIVLLAVAGSQNQSDFANGTDVSNQPQRL